MFITYGDTFLPTPSSYDELYYEIIRMHQNFDNLYSMGEWMVGNITELKWEWLRGLFVWCFPSTCCWCLSPWMDIIYLLVCLVIQKWEDKFVRGINIFSQKKKNRSSPITFVASAYCDSRVPVEPTNLYMALGVSCIFVWLDWFIVCICHIC